MFGMTEEELDLYRDMAQDYAVQDVTPIIMGKSTFNAPHNGDDMDREALQGIILDLGTIITLSTTHMAYDYARLQHTELDEDAILSKLHKKYEDYLFNQFIKYGLATTVKTINSIIGEVLLELPFMYLSAVDVEESEEDYLEKKMDAYEKYIEDNFSDDLDLDGYDEEELGDFNEDDDIE